VTPGEIPDKIDRDPDPQPDAGPGQFGTGSYIKGAIPGVGNNTGIMNLIGNSTGAKPAPPPTAEPPRQRVRLSGPITQGMLIRRVDPRYTAIIRQLGLQGTVVLHAVISREGTIERLQAVSGHPLLVQEAIGAVQQWRYKPYLLGGVPIEVETQITVNFVLRR